MKVYFGTPYAAGVPGLSIAYSIPNEATDRMQRERAPSNGVCEDSECGYADDGAIITWDENNLKTSMNILMQVFTEFGLNLNLSKTETMIINYQSTTPYPESILSLNDEQIKNVSAFMYLGVWISHDDIYIGNQELSNRVSSAHCAFSENRKLLTNMKIKLATRVMFLDSLVKSRLTYGCHTWKPTSAELSKINSTYNYFLRCMIWNGHKRINPPPRSARSSSSSSSSSDESEPEMYDWGYIINNERLREITKTKTITQYYELQQIKWIAHVIRRENDNICKILTFHSTKRKKRGRNIKSILERAI